ncbi:DgyrCDS5504 [Dimorphilus gyrociliatus]|uniref:DgyrCDS5504 n=1 Tax=Dimorphilus gyrociliatus TaxID=2664684 RepID=A0A7I8VLP5_9ANNE|nr:DgyrCDS5504 [Dimorphilus gyrociliatus]
MLNGIFISFLLITVYQINRVSSRTICLRNEHCSSGICNFKSKFNLGICNIGFCDCKEGYYPIIGHLTTDCKRLRLYNESCENDELCSDSKRLACQATKPRKCLCNRKDKWNGQECVPRNPRKLGEKCSDLRDVCIAKKSYCKNGICSCQNYFRHEGDSCRPVRMGDTCFTNKSCQYPSLCVNNKCKCPNGTEVFKDKIIGEDWTEFCKRRKVRITYQNRQLNETCGYLLAENEITIERCQKNSICDYCYGARNEEKSICIRPWNSNHSKTTILPAHQNSRAPLLNSYFTITILSFVFFL